MKRITKQDIKKLAETMPVIDEKSQREYIGGTYYVSSTTYQELGHDGYGDEIYVVYGSWGPNQINTSKPMSQENWDLQKRIFAQYTYVYTGYSGNLVVTSNTTGIPIQYVDGTLYFNVAATDKLHYRDALLIELTKIKPSISNSGNLSGGVSGSTSGTILDYKMQLVSIESQIRELDQIVLSAESNMRETIFLGQLSTRRSLAGQMFQCWRALNMDGPGYTMDNAINKCTTMPK